MAQQQRRAKPKQRSGTPPTSLDETKVFRGFPTTVSRHQWVRRCSPTSALASCSVRPVSMTPRHTPQCTWPGADELANALIRALTLPMTT